MGLKKLGKITMLELSDMDSNIYIVGDTVIDSGTGFNFIRMYSMLKAMKVDPATIKRVVNTHAHFDHIGGNGYFIKAEVAVHEADADIIEKADVQRAWADYFDGKMNPRKVKFKLKEGDKITTDGLELEVIHTPGHTPGSICLYERKQKILFSGDALFADGIGRFDLPGGNEEKLFSSVEKIMKLDINTLLPGHGEWIKEKATAVLKKNLAAPPEEEEDE